MSESQPSRMKRIAVVFPAVFVFSDPSHSSINIETYYHTLRELGYDVTLICPEGSKCSDDVEWMAVPLESLKQTGFWHSVNIDVAILFTWLHHEEELRALRAAGIFAISRGDADGMTSIRVFPGRIFDFIVGSQTQIVMRVRMLVHWLNWYLRLYRKMDARVIESIETADIVAVETNTARDNILKVLRYHHRPDPGRKIIVCPHLLADDILDAPMAPSKRQKIVAIGRWNARQKDAPLLADALRVCLRQEPDTDVVLIGTGGEGAFAGLRAEFPRVVCTGMIPRLEIKGHIADAQVLALSSRYETFHIAAHEALCFGCTVVGPDVIPLPDICGAGDYGQIAKGRNGKSLGAALLEEITRWRRGERNPDEIAQFWRARLQSTKILADMLRPVDAVEASFSQPRR